MNQSTNEDVQGLTFTRVETFGSQSEELIRDLPEDMQEQVHKAQRQNDLTQLLGVALRSVLPYADCEMETLRRQHEANEDGGLKVELDLASQRIRRGYAAVDLLNETQLFIKNTPEDAFDDTFEIYFADDDEDLSDDIDDPIEASPDAADTGSP